jgi:hypothetical protein
VVTWEDDQLALLKRSLDFVATSQDSQVIRNFLNSGAFENMLLLKTIREINATLTRRWRCSKRRTTIRHLSGCR